MAHSTLWYVGLGLAGLAEAVLLCRLVRALACGTVNVDVLFWTTWYGGLDVTASRKTSPLLYWFATAALMVVSAAVAGVFALLAIGR